MANWAVTARPVVVVVVRMKLRALSMSVRGSPAQFLLIWLNNRHRARVPSDAVTDQGVCATGFSMRGGGLPFCDVVGFVLRTRLRSRDRWMTGLSILA